MQYGKYKGEVASDRQPPFSFVPIVVIQSLELELVPALISMVRVLVAVLPQVSVAKSMVAMIGCQSTTSAQILRSR